MDEMIDTTIQEIAAEYTQRLEYELRGAWRAGYEMVHVYEYDRLAREPIEQFSIKKYLYVGMKGEPRPDPRRLEYMYSYDLTSVPDDVLKAAVRGELNE